MIEISDEKCVGCGICVYLCPVDDCLTGFNEIHVATTCIDCFKCVSGCPVNAITVVAMQIGDSDAAI